MFYHRGRDTAITAVSRKIVRGHCAKGDFKDPIPPPELRFKGTLTMKKVLGMLLTIVTLPACDSPAFARGGDGVGQAAASSDARGTMRRRRSRQRRRVRRKAVRAVRSSEPDAPRGDSPTPGAQPIDRLPPEDEDYAVGSPRPRKNPARRTPPPKPAPIPDIRNP